MEVQVVSKKMIKPSSPTPPHLRSLPFSYMDQIMSEFNLPIVAYYPIDPNILSNNDRVSENICHRAKMEAAFPDTLTLFYPLAGRRHSLADLHIDCNDEGALYQEAKVLNRKLNDVLDGNPDNESLECLFPLMGPVDRPTSPIMGIQVSSFTCGGIAVAVLISHRVADMMSLATFLVAWSVATRVGVDLVTRPSFDLGKHVPARPSFNTIENPPW